jgi:hypothetical protein
MDNHSGCAGLAQAAADRVAGAAALTAFAGLVGVPGGSSAPAHPGPVHAVFWLMYRRPA